ncbi:MAG TPA: hypothetical protein VFM29_06325 [Vicinamibacteria bacterium]|nr:hypothetical protein [Vicinamibacteria bacterium]
MKRYQWLAAVAALTCAVFLAAPAATEAGQLYRLSQEYSSTTDEIFTLSNTLTTFYTKTVTVPTIGTSGPQHFLFITLIGQGDVHGGNGTLLSCKLDGATDCLSSSTRVVQKLPTDEHDNSIAATWCVPAEPGAHTVTLQVASDLTSSVDEVYMEVVSVIIDAARLSQGACVVGQTFNYNPSGTD